MKHTATLSRFKNQFNVILNDLMDSQLELKTKFNLPKIYYDVQSNELNTFHIKVLIMMAVVHQANAVCTISIQS